MCQGVGHRGESGVQQSLPKTPFGSLGPGNMTIIEAHAFNIVARAAKASVRMFRLQNTRSIAQSRHVAMP